MLTNGAAARMGASAELPASLRGGLGLATAAGGFGAGGGVVDGLGGGPAAAGADFGAADSTFDVLAATLAAGGFATVGERAASRLAWGGGALPGAERLADEAGVFLGAGLRAVVAAFRAGRLAEEAGLDCALAVGLRRAAAVAFPAGLALARAVDAGRVGRLAAGLAGALGFGRDAATRRVAVACLAAAAFFVLGAGRAGRRDGLLTALPTRGRFPDPLAGVDAFI